MTRRLGSLGTVGWVLVAALLCVPTGVLLTASPNWIQTIMLVAAAGALVTWRPLYALLAMIVLYATSPTNVTLNALALAGATIAMLVAMPRVPARVVVPFAALLLISATTVPLSPAAEDTSVHSGLVMPLVNKEVSEPLSLELTGWIRFASVLALLCLAAWTVRDRGRLRTLAIVIMVSGVYPMFKGLEQWISGDLTVRSGVSRSLGAVRGTFEFPNYFAFFLLCVIAVAIVVFIESRNLWARVATGLYIAVATLCLFLTYTRSAWLGAAVMVLLLGLLGYRRLLYVGVLGLTIAALLSPPATHKVEERFSDLSGNAGDSSSWKWRTNQWERMVPRGMEQPVFGHGFGSYEGETVKEFGVLNTHYDLVDEANPDAPRGVTAHNDYVRLFVETGVVGLVLWILTLTGLIVVAARARRRPEAGPAATTALALSIALVGVSAADNIVGYTLILMVTAVLVGASWGVAEGSREPAEAEPGRDSHDDDGLAIGPPPQGRPAPA